MAVTLIHCPFDMAMGLLLCSERKELPNFLSLPLLLTQWLNNIYLLFCLCTFYTEWWGWITVQHSHLEETVSKGPLTLWEWYNLNKTQSCRSVSQQWAWTHYKVAYSWAKLQKLVNILCRFISSCNPFNIVTLISHCHLINFYKKKKML